MLKRGHHAGDGVIEGSRAVEIRLPEFLQELVIVVPAPLIKTFTQGVRCVTRARHAAVLIASGCSCSAKHRADDFTGGVENQSLPEVARNSFVALVALATDGG